MGCSLDKISLNNTCTENTFYHFTKQIGLPSIAKVGLKAVVGKNSIGFEKTPKIFFAKGDIGALKISDVWLKIMLDKKYGTKTLCDVLNNTSCQMTIEKRNDIFEEMFNDMCCRSYLQLNLEEEIDFSYNDIDEAKETAINCKKHNMDNNIYERTKMIYGHYSNIDSMEVETFNMHTYSYKDIETNKIKQITTEDGKTDALSILLEVYDRCNSNCTKFELLDEFVKFSKEQLSVKRDITDKIIHTTEDIEEHLKVNGIIGRELDIDFLISS